MITDASPTSEIAIASSRSIDITSSITRRAYRLLIAMPSMPAPPAGYRVLYLLDGNRYFGSAAEAVRSNFNAPDVIVVGIGYPESAAFVERSVAHYGELSALEASLPPAIVSFMRERTFDMTLPVPAGHQFPGIATDPSRSGGIESFVATIEHDIMPLVDAMAPVDQRQSALFGHSLGGLAVLYALFTRPTLVRNFIAASPSIWWADRAIRQYIQPFALRVKHERIGPRVLVTMGADESTPLRPPLGRDPAEALALLRYADMVANGQALVGELQCVAESTGLEVADYAIFEHQGHGISVWPALGRAVEFAFQQD